MVIYLITNLVNNKKYLGRDANNNKNYYGGGKLIKEAIKKYGKENFKKEIIEYCLDKQHLLEREEYWLKYYNVDINKDFYNLTLSNKGWEKNKARPKGRINSPKTRALISKNGKGKTGKTSGKKVKVIQYSYKINKIKINEFPTIAEASKTTHIKASDITATCSHKQKSAGGYGWEYIETTKHRPKPVSQYKLETELILIKEYESIKQASFETKIPSSDIGNTCRKTQPTAGGFVWQYGGI